MKSAQVRVVLDHLKEVIHLLEEEYHAARDREIEVALEAQKKAASGDLPDDEAPGQGFDPPTRFTGIGEITTEIDAPRSIAERIIEGG